MTRVEQIVHACEEIDRARLASKTDTGDPLAGWFLGYMDWLSELHRLIWEEQ
jgi:hypothetical protein